MRKETTKVITNTKIICDVCGAKVKNDDLGWWECLNRCGEVVAEYFAPKGIDLCPKCQEVFTNISDKWKQERYERVELSDSRRQEFLDDMNDEIANGDW